MECQERTRFSEKPPLQDEQSCSLQQVQDVSVLPKATLEVRQVPNSRFGCGVLGLGVLSDAMACSWYIWGGGGGIADMYPQLSAPNLAEALALEPGVQAFEGHGLCFVGLGLKLRADSVPLVFRFLSLCNPNGDI